jgi:hypothetical protein
MRFQQVVPALSLSVLLAAGSVGAMADPAAPGAATLLPVKAVMNEKPAASDAEPVAPAPANPATAANGGFSVDIQMPTVTAVNSSMSAAELTRAFSGDLAGEAEKLAALTATSIRIPEITGTLTLAGLGEHAPTKMVFTYKDVDLEGVSNGIAKSVTIGSTKGTEQFGHEGSRTTHFTVGKFSVEDDDIGAGLGLFGFGPDKVGTTIKPLYKNLSIAGGSFSTPKAECSFGAITIAAFSARPFKLSISELMQLLASPDVQAKEPSPDTITKLVAFYADIFSAVQSTPETIEGIDCRGTDDHQQAFTFKTGPVTVGGFGNDRYPAVSLKDFAFSGADGSVGFDSATMKGMDLSGPINLVESAAKPLTKAWFEAHARDLIPAFEGFALSGLKLDVPDTNNPGQRIKAGLGDFDVTLGDYTDGVPMRISSAAHHAVFDVPPPVPGKPDDYAELRQLGITHLDLGYDLALHHDAASRSLVLDKFGVEGADLGSAVVAATLGNVDDFLFAKDGESATAAAMTMTFKSATLDLTDAGLGDIIFKLVAADQHTDAAQARTSVANMAQGVVLAGLASNPDARALGEAVGTFLSAAGKSLSIGLSAKDPQGLAMSTIAAAANNPQALGSAVSISATAK